jgi:hypothetical protein
MDQLFSRIFTDIYRETKESTINQVKDIIDRVEADRLSQRRQVLRADAKVFLLLNFAELFARPVQVHGDFSREQINQIITLDMETIVRNASRELTPERPEISAHMVLQSVAATWPYLELSKVRVWGAD